MRVLAAGVLVLALAGCGGGGAGGSPGKAPATAAEVAALVKCTGFVVDAGGQMYAKETGSCKVGDADVYVAVFADDKARDQWLQVATTAGGGGSYVKGDRWTAQAMTTDAAAKVVAASGGEAVN